MIRLNKNFYINMDNNEIITHAQFIDYAKNYIDSQKWEELLENGFVNAEVPMDTKTRCVIEAVVLELLNQGIKNFPCEWLNISTCTDDELLNFIKTYYD